MGLRPASVLLASLTLGLVGTIACETTESSEPTEVVAAVEPEKEKPDHVVLAGHYDAITAATFSPNGEMIATGSVDLTIRIWNREGQELQRYTGHNQAITKLIFSPDSRYLYSSSLDTSIRVWDVKEGTEVRRMFGHSQGVASIDVTFDGLRAVSGSGDDTIGIWNIQTGQRVASLRGHRRAVSGVVLLPDNRGIISASEDKTVRMWGISPAKQIRRFLGHTDWVPAIDVSEDGSFLLSAGVDRTVRYWQVMTGKEVLVMKGHEGPVGFVRFLSSRFAISGGMLKGMVRVDGEDDTSLRIWDLRTGTEIAKYSGHLDQVGDVWIDTETQQLWTVSFDSTVRTFALPPELARPTIENSPD